MRLVLIGPPGAGKGTQAARLSRRLGVPHISTGDLFRDHLTLGTPLGRLAGKYLETGELVPDHVTADMVRRRLVRPDARRGFLLDGFPRTVRQAGELSAMLAAEDGDLDAVVEFTAPEDVVVERLLNRGRADDTEEVIRLRQRTYRERTAPLLSRYADILVTINAIGTVDEIARRVVEALSDARAAKRAP
ncbi:adenylate kinase [Actinomadura madurae]|uniref:Adenylate kinase n=1 Tax=Actinomadura madurae TaxID=1993 RepID=A0A1I5KPE9_9ACTN|nr:adenylate kinase [Actinomadura madurae]SFO86934.1 Adenylate kinase [Actinomadura madurae]SPT49908.1 Adenylate kinase [Actinomadura madurae]